MIKFALLVILFVIIGAFMSTTGIFNLFGSGVSYISTGVIGSGIKSITYFISNTFDTIIFNSGSNFITSTGVNVGNISWVGTFVLISVTLFIFSLLWGLIFK